MAADAGHEVSLNCDVDANPEPRVTWVKRDCQSCQRVSTGRIKSDSHRHATDFVIREQRTRLDNPRSFSSIYCYDQLFVP